MTRTLTPLSSVAEKSSRWPCFGVAASSRRTAGRKPRSAMWSASSSTVTSTAPRSQWPCWMRSSSRPGQATHDVDAAAQPLHLRVLADAAEDGAGGQPGGGGERDQRLLDLADQLTGGREDQRAGLARRDAGGRTRRAGRPGAAGRRRSCRSRCGRGRGRRGRPASRAAWRPGSGWASVMSRALRAATRSWGTPRSAKDRRGACGRQGRSLSMVVSHQREVLWWPGRHSQRRGLARGKT